MAGDQKLQGDWYDTCGRNGLTLHLVAIFAVAIVILIIAGGILLSEAGKNSQPVIIVGRATGLCKKSCYNPNRA